MDYQKIMKQVKDLTSDAQIDLRGFNIFDSLKIVTTASVHHFALCDNKSLSFLVNSEEAKEIILRSSLRNVKVETVFEKDAHSKTTAQVPFLQKVPSAVSYAV